MKPAPIILPVSIASLTYEQVAKTLDHSLLRPELTQDEMRAGCEIAREYDVASVCISPASVPLAARILQGSDVHVGTVIGFPHGYAAHWRQSARSPTGDERWRDRARYGAEYRLAALWAG